MARVKRSVHAKKKRREVLKAAKGYTGSRRIRYRIAKEQVRHSGVYAYRDRRDRKGQFRRLWIARINAAVRPHGLSYSRFINGLKPAFHRSASPFPPNVDSPIRERRRAEGRSFAHQPQEPEGRRGRSPEEG